MSAIPQAITPNPHTNLLIVCIYIYIYIQIANKMGFQKEKIERETNIPVLVTGNEVFVIFLEYFSCFVLRGTFQTVVTFASMKFEIQYKNLICVCVCVC
jgi:hypothetical protein